MSENTDQFASQTIRMPKAIADKLKDIADTEHRSVNKQAVVFIEEGLQMLEKQKAGAAA